MRTAGRHLRCHRRRRNGAPYSRPCRLGAHPDCRRQRRRCRKRGHLWQPVGQHHPSMGLCQCHPRADALGRAHLRADGRFRVDPPILPLPGSPVRRANSSAIRASLRAHAAFSVRAQPPAASTNAASSSAARSPISGNEPSNNRTIEQSNNRTIEQSYLNPVTNHRRRRRSPACG